MDELRDRERPEAEAQQLEGHLRDEAHREEEREDVERGAHAERHVGVHGALGDRVEHDEERRARPEEPVAHDVLCTRARRRRWT